MLLSQALNKAIAALYAEVRARPEAREYIKRVVSEACELSMNRWRVSKNTAGGGLAAC